MSSEDLSRRAASDAVASRGRGNMRGKDESYFLQLRATIAAMLSQSGLILAADVL